MNIVEFAKSLNLSIATVSRALNDRPEVSQETRQFVLAKAKEIGFARNASARRLVTGRSHLIRLECPYNTHILSDRYLVELARALEEAAGSGGYDLLLHLGTQRRELPDIHAVDGLVIVASSQTTDADIDRLTSGGKTPAVVIMGSAVLDLKWASSVSLDTLSGIREALQLLASHGHVTAGYIGSGLLGDKIPLALSELMTETGLTWRAELAIEGGVSQEYGYKTATHLLTMPDRPTALLARTDILASSAVSAAKHLGLRVPEDVSIIGHDDIDMAALVDPPLTTVAVNIEKVAQSAIEALLSMITDDAPATHLVLGTQLITRQSVGDAPPSN